MPILERLAEWYLCRRGRFVLPRRFIGIAMGCCMGSRRKDGGGYTYKVDVPPGGRLICMNGTMVFDLSEIEEEMNLT